MATVARAPSRRLDTSVGVSGPHDFARPLQAPSSTAPSASTASRPTFRDVAQRPSFGTGRRKDAGDLGPASTIISENRKSLKDQPLGHGSSLLRGERRRHGHCARPADLPVGCQDQPATSARCQRAAERAAALPDRGRPCKRWRHRCQPRGGACSSMVRAGRS